MSNLFDALRPAVTAALLKAIADPLVPVTASAPPARTAAGIAEDAIAAVERDPLVQHAANGEPWYRSRVTLGAILCALAPLLGGFGVVLTPEYREASVALIVALGGVVGPALTLYGRWAAKTPLGSV